MALNNLIKPRLALLFVALVAALAAFGAQTYEADLVRRASENRDSISNLTLRSVAIQRLTWDLTLWDQTDEILAWVLINGRNDVGLRALTNAQGYAPARSSSIFHSLLLELALDPEEFNGWLNRSEEILHSSQPPFERRAGYSALLHDLSIRSGQVSIEMADERLRLVNLQNRLNRHVEMARALSRLLQVLALIFAIAPGVVGELLPQRRDVGSCSATRAESAPGDS